MRPVTRREMIERSLAASLGSTLGLVTTRRPAWALASCADPQAAGQSPTLSAPERAAMTAVAEAFRAKYDVPGLSVSIARHGRFLYEQGLGAADRERGEPLTPNHRFRIASVSKPITSTTIFDLVESGQLRLSDRVFGTGAALGTRFGRTPYGRWIEDITIEHLLTHTSGGWPNDARDPMFKHPSMNHEELISWTLDTLPLDKAPGKAFAYSNFGYCLLGRVIESVTGHPYAEHVRTRILERCGIQRMQIAGNTLADRQPLEVRYYGQGGEHPYTMNVSRMDSHGGWMATATDLATFAMHVDGFATTPNILRPETIQRMVTASAANPGYAKGWNVNIADNWWHTGSLPGTSTIMVRTSGGLCWAALTNTRRPDSDMGVALDNMVWNMVHAAGLGTEILPAPGLSARSVRAARQRFAPERVRV